MECLRKKFVPGRVLNEQYETVSPLNHGSFGMVVMARDIVSAKLVALKCLTKPSAAKDTESKLSIDDRSEELSIHARIGSHANVVNLLNSFETDTHSYLVLEYCSQGDLYEAIRQEKGPRETEHVRAFMLQLVSAVEFLHEKGIYHRDIKPENIFLTDDGDVKLGDFGLATTDAWSYECSVGSDRYMAPEQYDLAGTGLAPAKADVWSIGICLLNILFSRNPFGVPAMCDPLYADYVRDRQSLFDVFPNMSQDTFEILTHCLAIDPTKRSLPQLRDALERAVSFTTDDESLDEFCTENREVLTATANREPLRTPSITSPPMGPGDTFPWTKALHMTPQQPPRQLSIIPDVESVSEDLFPGSDLSKYDWLSKADTQSIESVVDSGLGVSLGSIEKQSPPVARSRPVAIAGSMPIFSGRAGSALASIFGKKKQFESKSWSDMWDEEEEEQAEMQRQQTMMPKPAKLSTLSQEDSEDDGRSTPRACLAELKNPAAFDPSASQESLKSKDDGVSEHTGFVFEEHHPMPKPSPPRTATPKRSLMDKWAALGDRRRAANNNNNTIETPSSNAPSQDATPKRSFRPSGWRRNIGVFGRPKNDKLDFGVWQQKEWNMSQDWRRSDHHLPSSPLRPHASQLDGANDSEEWVGGWRDFHL